MKQVSELTEEELDYWVAKAEGVDGKVQHGYPDFEVTDFRPSLIWSHGGPIIEREHIQSRFVANGLFLGEPFEDKWLCNYPNQVSEIGYTLLEAGMRCFVASKFGPEVDDSQDNPL